MFMTLYALVAMPSISLLIAAATLYGLGVQQHKKSAIVVKGEANQYIITLDNRIFLGFGAIRCVFIGQQFAIDTEAAEKQVAVKPFMKPCQLAINFTVKYRGIYQLGLSNLEITDMLGLFSLKRKIPTKFEIVCYPRITEFEHMPLAVHLLSKAPANFAMAQEDYSDYTDVRPYLPSDPIKKVHWKLTAKRNEWIVKNYQTSALNSMTILLDSQSRKLKLESKLKLEDAMMEYAVSALRYCLRHQMPTELLFGRHLKETGRHIGDFDPMYNVMARLQFTDEDSSVNEVLSRYLYDTSRNVNIVIITSLLDMTLYELLLNAVRFGHYIAVMYFDTSFDRPDRKSDDVFEKLQASGLNCVKITA